MNEQKHIINRQVLELTVPERGRIQYIQNKTSEIVRQKLHPVLDALFSKLAGQDEIIRIDKLVIDLGTIPENELENRFVERAVREIRDEINLMLKTGTKTAKLSNVDGKHTDIKLDFTKTSKSKDFLDLFVYFLESGYFPWWHKSSVTNGESVKNANKNIFKEVLNVESESLKNAIIPLLKNIQVRQRLVFQLNHSQLYELLKRLNAKLIESYSALFHNLLSCVGSAPIRKSLTESFYEIALQYFSMELELNSESQKIGFVKDILDSVLTLQSDRQKETILIEILRAAQINQQKSARKETVLILVAVIQLAIDLSSNSTPLQEIIHNIYEKNEPVINSLVDRFSENTGKVTFEKTEDKKEELRGNKSFSLFSSQPATDSEEIVVFNAGLILIHPFLRYFFEGLNLLDKELQFKSQSDAFKAIHLLQFITTGNETAPETDLPLNKILCGLEVSEPVPGSVPLSKEEKEECIHLIKTVLERWEALKTNNPAALRETFLQREGILKQAGQSWNLTIERNAFDVMLEKLPWSFSLVKLPWCEQILYVEW